MRRSAQRWCAAFGAAALLVVPVALPSDTEAQAKVPRVGVLAVTSPAVGGSGMVVFRKALGDLGYTPGRAVSVEFRWADGRVERLPELARQLVDKNVDLIVTSGNQSTIAARNATRTIPIIMVGTVGAVEAGLVESLSHPGGNVTGVTAPRGMGGKQLELLRELVPSLSTVVLLVPDEPGGEKRWTEAKALAQSTLGLTLETVAVREPTDFARAFGAVKDARPDAMIVGPDPLMLYEVKDLLDFSRTARLPTMYPFPTFVDLGGLISYSPNADELYRSAARFVDRILKGQKPADLPVEEPTRFELVINRKTANALGITIPPAMLLRADRVIE